jgi:predicted transcriptional regulator
MELVANIMKALADDKTLTIFKTIAYSEPNTAILIAKIELTRKQYYSRLSLLMKNDLIKRKHGKYTLTALGKIIHNFLQKIENSMTYYWKLKAIDSVEETSALSSQELASLVETLIEGNHEIKQFLLAR